MADSFACTGSVMVHLVCKCCFASDLFQVFEWDVLLLLVTTTFSHSFKGA